MATTHLGTEKKGALNSFSLIHSHQLEIPFFLEHVEKRLKEELDRINTYLDTTTRKLLISQVETQLLAPHVTVILDKGFESLAVGLPLSLLFVSLLKWGGHLHNLVCFPHENRMTTGMQILPGCTLSFPVSMRFQRSRPPLGFTSGAGGPNLFLEGRSATRTWCKSSSPSKPGPSRLWKRDSSTTPNSGIVKRLVVLSSFSFYFPFFSLISFSALPQESFENFVNIRQNKPAELIGKTFFQFVHQNEVSGPFAFPFLSDSQIR